ncbi:OB-fold protein [Pseudomonas agarici]|uniref:OB-fold protein n=1 Tax=Pseudomonas agarici TaxID=46677 RepID=UPI0015A245F8|nr:hypothetical protein [Pseudomonas agarici]NWB92317.1 hypothetical protein [Pseudomonas agarici]
MTTVTVPEKRQVGFLLGIGILLFPLIFAWFLLRKGHSTLSRVLGFGLLILVLLIIVVSASAPPAGKSATSSAPAATSATPATAVAPAPATEEIKVYASSKIAADYEENTVAADMLYKGKRVGITGKIQDINTSFMGDPYLILNAKNQFNAPHAEFEKSQLEAMAKLKKGQSVNMVCTGKGDVAKTPVFKECELAK